MQPTISAENTIEYIAQPAFLVKDNVVAAVNEAAARMQIKIGTSIHELITAGADEFSVFRSGKLYLALTAGNAWVSICDDAYLFCLEEIYSSAELKALALAAQHLREPLSNAMSGIDILKQNDALENNNALKQQVSSINRSIHNLLRSVCNMSDASPADIRYKANLQIQNAASVFAEIFEKLGNYTEEAGRSLKFIGLKKSVECAIDAQLMERAILNMVSNAIKFSPEGSTITATIKQTGNRLSVTIENPTSDNLRSMYSGTFQQYRRIPSIEDGLSGIGLGMSIISGIANAHNGTVLLDSGKKNVAKITVSFPIRTNIAPSVHSSIQLLGGYTGGIDAYLVELSDVLTNRYYE